VERRKEFKRLRRKRSRHRGDRYRREKKTASVRRQQGRITRSLRKEEQCGSVKRVNKLRRADRNQDEGIVYEG
jgi:hypothetical protein